MSRSVRLLARIGIAIEKLGQNISKIGGGGCVHAKSGADLGARRPVSIDDYRGKPDAKNAVNLGPFGNAVDEDGRLVVKNNVKGSFANGDLPKAVGHAGLQYQSLNCTQQASLGSLLSSPPVRRADVLRVHLAMQAAEKRCQDASKINQPSDPQLRAVVEIGLLRDREAYRASQVEYDRVFRLWKRGGYPE